MGRGAFLFIFCLSMLGAVPLEAGFFSSKPACPDIFNTVSEGYYFRTERLELAPLGKNEVDQAVSITTHPDVKKMSGENYPPEIYRQTFQGSQSHIPVSASDLKYVSFGVKDREKKMVGVVQLIGGDRARQYLQSIKLNPKPGQYAITGYHVSPSSWGNGIATEATARVFAYTFDHLKLDGIYTSVVATNVRSIRVLEKSGFQKVGESGEGDALQYHYFLSREAHQATKH